MGNKESRLELEVADGDPFLLCVIKLFKAADYEKADDLAQLHVWLTYFKNLRL